jgi:hypothetical protein
VKSISIGCGKKSTLVMMVFVGFSLFSLGCGGPFSGSVSGKVTYNGKPLPGGYVTFVHADGRTKQVQIQTDGSYSIPDAPGGDVKVAVKTVPPIPAMPRNPFSQPGEKSEPIYPAGPYVPIPVKYADEKNSGLSTKINRGGNTYDIDLQPEK